MKLESQVCSLELSKRLKELGVKQDGYFCWADDGSIFSDGKIGLRMNHHDGSEECSAFTVAELGEMLGDSCRTGLWKGTWTPYDGSIKFLDMRSKTEADARAKLLIYMIESKKINPEKNGGGNG